MGQLRSWCSQQVVFVGGTLIDHGGQNPIEAAEQGCAWRGPRASTSSSIRTSGRGRLGDANPASLKAGLQQALELTVNQTDILCASIGC